MAKTYYRLLCLQGTGYMGTGYNATSHEELAEAYASYKSNDWDDDDMGLFWKKMTLDEKIRFIQNDEFEIEESDKPFDEADIH